ncbi:hypothetical protein CAL7716_042100 [Calothrix sp. PCC 7716]|nr:hypothetical protein CAL7716_042100 [Calothrix sp. PCC 7716]
MYNPLVSNIPVSDTKKPEPAATLKITFPDRSLREQFKAACALNGKNMNEAIIEFVREYVQQNQPHPPTNKHKEDNS